ncbi:MAG: lytic murein transglycosylase [Gammaproteobacteria bacterium]|nr:lytic murein transglycosylase [Gammaproteobacteria bacterium]
MKRACKGIGIIIGLLSCGFVWANSQAWGPWVAAVRQEALGQGIRPEVFDAAFKDIHEPSQQIKHFSRSQPEHRLTYGRYLKTRVDAYRVTMGRKQYLKNQALLEKIGQTYDVDPCFIVAFWGMETSYGTYMGDFPSVKALATLAYDSKRPEFFRHELFLALRILNEGHVSLSQFKGEWAGASGQPQFLPSSFFKYAVDYDGDGRKDIWTSHPDVFASIANYMKQNGWKGGQPWAYQVKLPSSFDQSLVGKTIIKPVSEWESLGVRLENGQSLPEPQLQACLVHPNEGPVFLALPNYKMILRYNNSIYYAGAIGYLAEHVCHRT